MTGVATLDEVRTTVTASLTTPSMVAQTLDMDVEPERELVLDEALSTIALQRQVKQNFAAGRFERDSAVYSYADIGRLMFVPARIPLRLKFEADRISIARCMFAPSMFDDVFGPQGDRFGQRLQGCLNIRSPAIRNLLIRIAREIENPADDTADMVHHMGQVLAMELKRHFAALPLADGLSRGGLSRAALRRAIERIEADAPPPSLDELAAIAGVSKRHLTRAFRQSTGQTVHEKIDEARFGRAMRALTTTDMAISELAARSGFGSVAAFSAAFSRWAAESPARFRARTAR